MVFYQRNTISHFYYGYFNMYVLCNIVSKVKWNALSNDQRHSCISYCTCAHSFKYLIILVLCSCNVHGWPNERVIMRSDEIFNRDSLSCLGMTDDVWSGRQKGIENSIYFTNAVTPTDSMSSVYLWRPHYLDNVFTNMGKICRTVIIVDIDSLYL